MQDAKKAHKCSACGEDASRWLPENVSSTFNHKLEGVGPQNTGVQSLDVDYDRVIGESALQGWTVQRERYRDKVETITQEPQIQGEDLSRNPDGSYRVLSENEKGIHQRANKINSLAINFIKEKKGKASPRESA